MGHAHLGGKTVLVPDRRPVSGQASHRPRAAQLGFAPLRRQLGSQSAGVARPRGHRLRGLRLPVGRWDDHPRRPGVDDYLHEAALANDPPSGTFYDPDHPHADQRLASLGVHEHWNNAEEKKYSRNLGTGEGIELVAAGPA